MSNVIEQAAREYADVAKSYLLGEEMELVRNAFEAGAEWALANQWHEIEEKQPPFMQIVILADSAQRFCLGYINTENKLRKCAKEKIDLEKITHWCEIPQFENKQSKR